MYVVNTLESLLFDWVSHKLAISHRNCMAASKNDEGILTMLIDLIKRDDLLLYRCFTWSPAYNILQIHSCQTLDDQVILSEGTCLVKAANINLTSIWNSKWFSAEDLFLDHGDDGIVNCK